MIVYDKTDWSKNNRMSASALNNIENGIVKCVEFINSISNTLTEDKKESYDVSEINGAVSVSDLSLHNTLGTAHESLFLQKANAIHSHNIESIEDLSETLSRIENKLNLIDEKFKALSDYVDMISEVTDD